MFEEGSVKQHSRLDDIYKNVIFTPTMLILNAESTQVLKIVFFNLRDESNGALIFFPRLYSLS